MDRVLHEVHDFEKLFYYGFSENESNNLVLRLVLSSCIKKSILKKALNKTLERYPNFRQTPVVDKDGYLHTRDNDREADVYAYDPEPVNLGTEETNGFLFRVMFEGNTLWISIFHALCDGSGFKMFTRSLLYHYCTFSGRKIRNEDDRILTENVPADPTELRNPLDDGADCPDSPNPYKPTESEDVFLLPEPVKEPDRCRENGLARFILHTDKLVDKAKALGTTVDTYLHLLTAKTIHDHYDVGDKQIRGIGTVDLRPFYGNKYLQNHVDLFWINYPGSIFNLSDSEACDMIRRAFKEPQLKKELFDGGLKAKKESYQDLFDFPITDQQRLAVMRQTMWYVPEIISTYFLTNVVCLDLGQDLDPMVIHADIYGTAVFREPVLFILTHGNETSVNIVQRNLSRAFPEKMRQAFREEGLLAHSKLGDFFEYDKVRIDMIPQV